MLLLGVYNLAAKIYWVSDGIMTWLENHVCIKYVSANMHKIFGILFWAFRADCNGSVSSEYALLMMREINCAWSYLTQWLWQVSFSGPVFPEVTLTSHNWNGKRSKMETLCCGLRCSSSVSTWNGEYGVIIDLFLFGYQQLVLTSLIVVSLQLDWQTPV